MDYNSTWLSSSTSLSLCSSSNGNTLPLFEETPVHRNFKRTYKVEEVQTSSDETGAMMEELKNANAENKRLTEMLSVVCENYKELKRQLMDYMSTKSTSSEMVVSNVAKKRKIDNSNNSSSEEEEENSCPKICEEVHKAKISRVAVRTEASDSTLILKDGYQWRKYGQKVTRDNPCPRAYFKCSFAPTCPVKKKVQRSLEDQSLLVATYEGEHNHAPPPSQEATSGSNNRAFNLGSVPCSSNLGSSGPTVSLGLTKPKPNISNEAQKPKFNSPDFQKLVAEQMASSLTKDPKFTAALAAALCGRFGQQSSSDN